MRLLPLSLSLRSLSLSLLSLSLCMRIHDIHETCADAAHTVSPGQYAIGINRYHEKLLF